MLWASIHVVYGKHGNSLYVFSPPSICVQNGEIERAYSGEKHWHLMNQLIMLFEFKTNKTESGVKPKHHFSRDLQLFVDIPNETRFYSLL